MTTLRRGLGKSAIPIGQNDVFSDFRLLSLFSHMQPIGDAAVPTA